VVATDGYDTPLVRVVMVGHVDHGKSTLIGRIRQELAPMVESSEDNLAFVVDQLQEERDNLMTIDTTQTVVHTPRGRLVFIDVPGHQELLQNMLSGATRADAAVLVLAADEGVQVQTRRHALLASLLGLRNLVVVANKMDLALWSEQAFRELETLARNELDSLGLNALAFVPIAATTGANVVERASEMPWYAGPTLMELLTDLEPASESLAAVRLPVQDVYSFDATPVAVGRLLSGRIAEGDMLVACPALQRVTVREIRRFPPDHSPAEAGAAVALVLDGAQVARGDVIAGIEGAPAARENFDARVFWLGPAPLALGDEVDLRCATQLVSVHVTAVLDRLDSASLTPLPPGSELGTMDLATVTLHATRPLVVESFATLPALGRFTLERGGSPAGFGILP
jgi:bifunctional enzyme CysN/CysC